MFPIYTPGFCKSIDSKKTHKEESEQKNSNKIKLHVEGIK